MTGRLNLDQGQLLAQSRRYLRLKECPLTRCELNRSVKHLSMLKSPSGWESCR